MGESLQVPLNEESEVEEDDGEFCEADEEFVYDLTSVPVLRSPLELTIQVPGRGNVP